MIKKILLLFILIPDAIYSELYLKSFKSLQPVGKTVQVNSELFNVAENKQTPILEKNGKIIFSVTKLPGKSILSQVAKPAKTYAFRFLLENGFLKIFRHTEKKTLTEV